MTTQPPSSDNSVVIGGRFIEKPTLLLVDGVNHVEFEIEALAGHFTVVATGVQAERASKYGEKGRKVVVSGALSQQTWKLKNGHEKSRVVVVGSSIRVCNTQCPVDLD